MRKIILTIFTVFLLASCATEDEKCICAVRVTPEEAHIMHIESLQKRNGLCR